MRARLGANLATLANGAMGVGAVLYVLAGNPLWAMLLVVGGIAFDGLDGMLSRRAGGPASRAGRYADSAADAVTFGVAPAALLGVHTSDPGLWAPYGLAAWFVGAAFLALALTRLAYFTARGYRRSDFVGASTPQSALALVVLLLFFDVPAYGGVHPALALGGAAALAALMVAPIPYPKMRRGAPLRATMTFTGLAAFVALVPAQFRPAAGSPLDLVAYLGAVLLAAGVAVYYVVGPWTVRREEPEAREALASRA
jgi:phosphatidylserine synthase